MHQLFDYLSILKNYDACYMYHVFDLDWNTEGSIGFENSPHETLVMIYSETMQVCEIVIHKA